MKKNRIICTFMAILLVLTFSVVGVPVVAYGAASTTSEVSNWATEDVETAVFYGFVSPELLEEPFKEAITREEFASLVVRVWERETSRKIEMPSANPFLDTDSEDVLKAYQLDIVNGLGNGEYGPQETLTREAAATMLTRLYLDITGENLETNKTSYFQDDKEIHQWAKGSVYYMAKKGLLKGNYANEFMPLDFISREQAVVISVRMVKEILRNNLDYAAVYDYKPGEKVASIADMENVFRYAQYHLLPSISLTMEPSLAESLKAEYSDIMTKMEIENLTYSYSPGTKKYTATMKYSLMGEVLSLIINENISLSCVSPRAKEIQTKLIVILKKIISPEMNYYQREKAIHDYIVKNYSYDLGSGGSRPDESYSLYGLLKNGKGVCQAYSQLFWALCLNAKIPCGIVYGTAEGGAHAWNRVKIYGDCYHVDVTWDDPIPDRGQEVRYTYYNVSEQFIKKDHQWEDVRYSSCDFVTYSH